MEQKMVPELIMAQSQTGLSLRTGTVPVCKGRMGCWGRCLCAKAGWTVEANAFVRRPYFHSGSNTVNKMLSFLLSAAMLPPCSSTISFAIARPSPAPPVVAVREASTR